MQKSSLVLFIAISIIIHAIPSVFGSSNAYAQDKEKPGAKPDSIFTPVVVSVISAPDPVKGSDSMYHFVYELEALNATGLAWTIDSIDVLGDGKPVASFKSEELKNRMELLKDKSPSTTLQPGEAGVIFIHFSMEGDDIPGSIAHKITISVPNGIPEGFKNFAGIPADSESYAYMTGVTVVGSPDAIVIGPPLEGKGWVAADGCCDAKRHIRALMPIDDKLVVAQRFAIDWEMINGDRKIFVGDPKDVESYFAYGQNAVAAADAKVITAIDKYKDQIPGELPPGMTLEEADGNHIVLDLGGGKYALYAHLKPGSVKVKAGDTVKRGQVMGIVGNTGNTSAPHLHFHVMDGPSTLGSNGLPYVIDEFESKEKAPSTEAFDKAEIEGIPLEVVPVDKPGIHKNELPLDQSVVVFTVTGN
ncbi:MAG TPA: M23 family metallopeptidase [Thermodesulfobacteriota bacterium]|nr:M23 family metallopeptidase [Thermodesulfobacteriota bacterium]